MHLIPEAMKNWQQEAQAVLELIDADSLKEPEPGPWTVWPLALSRPAPGPSRSPAARA